MKKNIYLLIWFFIILSGKTGFSQCTAISLGSIVNNVTANSGTISFGCCLTGTYYLEYGPQNFTPGTGSTPGTGGTLINIPSNPGTYVLSGLNVETSYDVYLRRNCSGTTWSPNSTKASFTTAPNCAGATAISCNTFYTFNPTLGTGAWSNICQSIGITLGKEKIYSFTPAFSGYASLLTQVTSGNSNIATFFYKAASAGCNNTGWNCIGPAYQMGVNQYTFGPLTAGTQYYILADENSHVGVPVPTTFRIECGYCAAPANVSGTSVSPTSATITWSGGAYVLEYGPVNFVPGTGTTPGTNGNVVFVSGSSHTLNGLTPGTAYHIYLRSFCNGNFSPNSIRYSIATLLCPTAINYTPLGTTYAAYSSQPGYYFSSCIGNSSGEESYFNFTPPASGFYKVTAYPDYISGASYNFLTKIASAGNCDVSNFTCMIPDCTIFAPYPVDFYDWGPLTAGTTYQMLFDCSSTSPNPGSPDVTFTINCPEPGEITASDIRPTSVNITWNCNCPSSTYLEYGPLGFVPGTGATPGTNGTLISNISSPYTITGLSNDTKYDIYLRVNCGGTFLGNSDVISIRTAQNCASLPAVSCSDYLQFCVNASGPLAGGAWSIPGSCSYNPGSRENLWKFTPAQTGTYSLLFYSMSANSFNYIYPASIFIRTTAGYQCNEQGWNCVGTVAQSSGNFTPVTISLGTLNVGTEYVIMVDGVQPTFTAGYCYYFRINCPNVCEYPRLLAATQITSSSANIYMGCSSCFGNLIVEYGPAGFTPGTGSTAGAGGTVVAASAFPINVTGLSSNTTYDVYARQNCGSGSFSVNSTKISFTTTNCNVAPTSISSNDPNNTICNLSSVTLTQNGGIPGAGGSVKWYSGSCGGSLAGTGNSIIVSPNVSTTYYARTESSCGVSACANITITVVPLPTAVISVSGSTAFCAGTTKLISANSGSGLTYQWKKYGNNIPGATASTYLANKAGKYKCQVTNVAGCSKNSNSVTLSVIPLPQAIITASGPTTFCSGDSVIFTANPGAGLSYQWKKGTNNIPGATAISYTAKLPGKYKCIVTNSQGCAKGSNSFTVSIPCREGAYYQIKNEITLFPNPAQNEFVISLGINVSENVSISIYDLAGKIVSYSVDNISENEYRIYGLPKGVYHVEVQSDLIFWKRKVIILPF